MKNEIWRIIFVSFLLFCLIGVVSASENITETQLINEDYMGGSCENSSIISDSVMMGGSDEDLLDCSDYISLNEDEKPSDMYVNCSKEENGDGLSPETAFNYKSLRNFRDNFPNLANNGTVHLSEGIYEISRSSMPEIDDNTSIHFRGQDGTIITHCYYNGWSRFNPNRTVTFINIIFDVPSNEEFNNCIWFEDVGQVHYSINLGSDSGDFNFVNCTFINTSFVMSDYEHRDPNRSGNTDTCTATFENCKFLNYTYDSSVTTFERYTYDIFTGEETVAYIDTYDTTSMFTAFEYSKFIFNNCQFDNISCDAIVDSYGGHIDNYGRVDGVYIYNSSFSNCSINGIVKARQASSYEIINCTYDFPASTDIPLVGPFYIDQTDRPVIKTNLNVVANDNTLAITLTDESNNPLVDYEVEIVINGKVSYEYTDNDGKIILSNLLGNYSFEITFPGDEYAGYTPSKVLRNFTFEKAKLGTVLIASKVTATYNVAKNLAITLKDKNGKVLAKKTVTVKVGSITKTLTTNAKGQISLNIASLVPKTYTATIKFAGESSYTASIVKPKVVVNKAKVKLNAKPKTFKVKAKTKKFSVILRDSKNRVIKGKKLTIKVKGKTYTATTNKKGIATFKITKLSKKGTFNSKITFKGDKYYKAISKTVKIKVK